MNGNGVAATSWMRRCGIWIGLWVGIVSVLCGFFAYFLYESTYGHTLLRWRDSKTGTRVRLAHCGDIDHSLRLYVTRDGRRQEEDVIDKSDYGTLRFALHNHRLLVINGDYIFAAYDLGSNEIIHYNKLPFTIYESQGTVVASTKYGDKVGMRPDFPYVKESGRP